VFGTFVGGLGAGMPADASLRGIESTVAQWYREHAEEVAK
jgi:hypothetical protein